MRYTPTVWRPPPTTLHKNRGTISRARLWARRKRAHNGGIKARTLTTNASNTSCDMNTYGMFFCHQAEKYSFLHVTPRSSQAVATACKSVHRCEAGVCTGDHTKETQSKRAAQAFGVWSIGGGNYDIFGRIEHSGGPGSVALR